MAFLARTIKEKKTKTTPDAVSKKKRKTFLNPMIIPVSRPVRSCRRFLQYSLFYYFFYFKKHESQYATELPASQLQPATPS